MRGICRAPSNRSHADAFASACARPRATPSAPQRHVALRAPRLRHNMLAEAPCGGCSRSRSRGVDAPAALRGGAEARKAHRAHFFALPVTLS